MALNDAMQRSHLSMKSSSLKAYPCHRTSRNSSVAVTAAPHADVSADASWTPSAALVLANATGSDGMRPTGRARTCKNVSGVRNPMQQAHMSAYLQCLEGLKCSGGYIAPACHRSTRLTACHTFKHVHPGTLRHTDKGKRETAQLRIQQQLQCATAMTHLTPPIAP